MASRKCLQPLAFVTLVVVATSSLALIGSGAAATVASAQSAPAVHHDTSPPLRDIPPAPRPGGQQVIPVRPVRPETARGPDPVIQSSVGPATIASSANFDGIGNGVAGYSVLYAPPDTN